MNQSTATAALQHELSDGQRSVVRTLLYYHIFGFPLSVEELHRFSTVRMDTPADLEPGLQELVAAGLIGSDRGYFFIGDESHVDERQADESRARDALPTAVRWSRFIAHFPHVRGVAVSGTLSKGVMKEGDDLDYLVYTEPGRVWLCRLWLMGFKKLFLFNSHHHFCINYLMAEDHLEIPDRDLFTATEVAWLLPTVNRSIHDRLLESNSWIEDFFPNWRCCPNDGEPLRRGFIKTVVESCSAGIVGQWLDGWSHRMIGRRNERRYRHLEIQHEVALRSEKHASKHHPRAFRERVLRRLDDEIVAFESKHGIVITDWEEGSP